MPYLLSGDPQLDQPVDALFESMSGFSTTGASILTDVEAVDHSLLLWRQFTQWVGGMGIIVLALAVLPRLRVGGRQLLDSEMPGPETDPLAERIRTTARRLWLLYVALTAALATVLVLFGVTGIDDRMGLFEAVSIAFATLPTGGFMPDSRSLAEFAPASQWVVILFMVIAGINFALVYRAAVRRTVAEREQGSRAPALSRHPRRCLGHSRRRDLGGGHRPRRVGRAPRRLPGRVDHDDNGVREHRTSPPGRPSPSCCSSA